MVARRKGIDIYLFISYYRYLIWWAQRLVIICEEGEGKKGGGGGQGYLKLAGKTGHQSTRWTYFGI